MTALDVIDGLPLPEAGSEDLIKRCKLFFRDVRSGSRFGEDIPVFCFCVFRSVPGFFKDAFVPEFTAIADIRGLLQQFADFFLNRGAVLVGTACIYRLYGVY